MYSGSDNEELVAHEDGSDSELMEVAPTSPVATTVARILASLTQPPTHTWTIAHIHCPRLKWGDQHRGRIHRCPTCSILLLTGEKPGFCCGPNGSRYNDVTPLPPLPPEMNVIVNDPKASALSRFLNLMFSFASTETGEPFPPWITEGFMAVSGRIFHRVRPSHVNSGVKWLLYDHFMYNNPPHKDHRIANDIPTSWIIALSLAMINNNPFAQCLMKLGMLTPEECPGASVILEDPGSGSELAAVMSYHNTSLSEIQPRKIVIVQNDTRERYIPTVSRLWEPLAYPLFFPTGSLGWGVVGKASDITRDHSDDENPAGGHSSSQIWHYRARLLREPRFQIFGHLANEYIVDMFSRNLECRLHYIRQN